MKPGFRFDGQYAGEQTALPMYAKRCMLRFLYLVFVFVRARVCLYKQEIVTSCVLSANTILPNTHLLSLKHAMI